MRILIAEDDAFFRPLLQQLLTPEGEVTMVEDGAAAWKMLQQTDGPILAILDWVMPGLTGPEICREARLNPKTSSNYLILLTARNSSADILAGLRAGADDFVTKPVDAEELRSRVRLGRRIMALQEVVATQESALAEAFARENLLRERLSFLQSRNSSQANAPAPLSIPHPTQSNARDSTQHLQGHRQKK